MNARNVPEPAADWNDNSVWTQTVHVLRDELGHVQAATYLFELSLRFPTPVGVWAIDIHKGRAGVDGPPVHDFLRRSQSEPLLFTTGFGSGLGIRMESFLDG